MAVLVGLARQPHWTTFQLVEAAAAAVLAR
jgi:hypothetical protein